MWYFPTLFGTGVEGGLAWHDMGDEDLYRCAESRDPLEQEERVDAPNQKLDDLWAIPLHLERWELRLREWRRCLRKYRCLLKQVEDWLAAGEIRHLLRDVLSAYRKKRMEDMRRSGPRSVRQYV